ncbi:phage antirepressor KilAC domain-containing protein [Acholeplasma laidlawii]|uniref:phage antirepressor KilAC domain-containing protein n=1 Tax=Acholeplasma laidlawii TaxID=2148 RepID=UPI0018C1F133|nr:phage antirepressor KilAC domain-containing protein [Acholeplasma laidlawii]MBG0763094.1 phage antirepressor KilAC domain-containing protein [Acholeplasma laidlawii]
MQSTFKVKEVKKANFGKIKIASTMGKEFLYCLKDICKLFSINLQTARVKIGNKNIYEIPIIKKDSESKTLFTNKIGLTECLTLSQDEKADMIYEWLLDVKEKMSITFNNYTVDDLKNKDTASFILNKLNELSTLVSVQNVKIEENMEKVHLYDGIFGKKGPIDLTLVPTRIKYRNISLLTMLEILRTSGVFNERNLPHQSYIDSLHFRLVTVTTNVKTTEVIATKVLVYKKGITLIEDLIRKKVGRK